MITQVHSFTNLWLSKWENSKVRDKSKVQTSIIQASEYSQTPRTRTFFIFFYVRLSSAWWKKHSFNNFQMFFIVFDQGNKCPSICFLVKIHNNTLSRVIHNRATTFTNSLFRSIGLTYQIPRQTQKKPDSHSLNSKNPGTLRTW